MHRLMEMKWFRLRKQRRTSSTRVTMILLLIGTTTTMMMIVPLYYSASSVIATMTVHAFCVHPSPHRLGSTRMIPERRLRSPLVGRTKNCQPQSIVHAGLQAHTDDDEDSFHHPGQLYSDVFDLYPEDEDIDNNNPNDDKNNQPKQQMLSPFPQVLRTTTVVPSSFNQPTKRITVSAGPSATPSPIVNIIEQKEDDDARFSFGGTKIMTHDPTLLDEWLKYFPMVLPFLAYLAYDPTAELFATCLDGLAQTNWVAVDGGAYQAKIIAPAINGVVVPAISILFANLIGTTIQTLRQRQVDIQTCLNMEAGQLRILSSMFDFFATTSSSTSTSSTSSSTMDSATICRRYLTQYTTRLIAESQPAMNVESLDYSLDTELNGILAELNRLSSLVNVAPIDNDDENNKNRNRLPSPPSPLILGNAYTACTKLYEERAKRITALRSLFPPLHFVIVSALAISICIAFLLESKQDILVFLNAIQLRILWTMLVGTFTALAIVCYDLGNPFRGSYQISKSVHQLYTIRMTLRSSLKATTTTTTTTTTTPAAAAGGNKRS